MGPAGKEALIPGRRFSTLHHPRVALGKKTPVCSYSHPPSPKQLAYWILLSPPPLFDQPLSLHAAPWEHVGADAWSRGLVTVIWGILLLVFFPLHASW